MNRKNKLRSYIVSSLLTASAVIGCDKLSFSFPLPSNPDSELNAGRIKSPRDLIMNYDVRRVIGKYVAITGRSSSQFQMALSPPNIEGKYSVLVQDVLTQSSPLENQIELTPQTQDNLIGIDTFPFLSQPSVPLGNEVIRGGDKSFSAYTVRTTNTGVLAFVIITGQVKDKTIIGEFYVAAENESFPDRAGTFTLRRQFLHYLNP